jgi:hypothetical protein
MITKRIQTTSGAEIVAVNDDDGWDHITIDANLTLNAEDALRVSDEIDEAVSWLWERNKYVKQMREDIKAQELKKEHKSWFSSLWGA